MRAWFDNGKLEVLQVTLYLFADKWRFVTPRSSTAILKYNSQQCNYLVRVVGNLGLFSYKQSRCEETRKA